MKANYSLAGMLSSYYTVKGYYRNVKLGARECVV